MEKNHNLVDTYNRKINYLRISVTDRCNLRCIYCMPEEGVEDIDHPEILRFGEILEVVEAAAAIGITRIRLTGGEPLVRKGLVDFIRDIRQKVPAIEDISMTTNGVLLGQMAEDLKEAGLNRANISLDTMDRKEFIKIARRDRLPQVLEGIQGALKAGLTPVKLNTVLIRDFNEEMLGILGHITTFQAIHARFIEFMPIGDSSIWSHDKIIPVAEMKEKIEAQFGPLEPVSSVFGCGPARYYRIPGALGTIGFISPISNHFCSECNRLRLTADGKIRPCLLSDYEVDIKKLIRQGATAEELEECFRLVVRHKPEGHHLDQDNEERHYKRTMSKIGG